MHRIFLPQVKRSRRRTKHECCFRKGTGIGEADDDDEEIMFASTDKHADQVRGLYVHHLPTCSLHTSFLVYVLHFQLRLVEHCLPY